MDFLETFYIDMLKLVVIHCKKRSVRQYIQLYSRGYKKGRLADDIIDNSVDDFIHSDWNIAIDIFICSGGNIERYKKMNFGWEYIWN